MRRSSLLFLTFSTSAIFTTACGSQTVGDSGNNVDTDAPASATLTVTSQRPVENSSTGASYTLSVSFTETPTRCTNTTIGACTVNPCYRSTTPTDPNVPLPSAGTVTLMPASGTPFTVQPQNDGLYASETAVGELPWTTGGQSVTWTWTHFPGNASQPGDQITLSTPPYIALTKDSAFNEVIATLVRTNDLTVSWTNDSPPSANDDVNVGVNAATTQVYCTFPASAGTGVVPAAALQMLQPGEGSYGIHSKQYASESMTAADLVPWSLSVNIDAAARSSYGLATGSLIIE
jgi:hypothetical protein